MSVIKRSDLIEDEAFNWPKEYAKQLEIIAKKSKGLGGSPSSPGSAPGSTPRKQLDELAKVQLQLAKATERSTQEFIEQKAGLDKVNKANREAVKVINQEVSAYDKLSKELNDTRNSYKNLAAAGKANTTVAKNQLNQIRKLDTQLKKIDSSVGQNQRSVGKYSDALKGVTARFLGWAAVAAVLFKALKSGVQIVINYTKANSTLNAILKKTSKETEELRKQQQELGRSTAFSATQVTKAQTELSRLGLSISEITALTPAILDAAVAFGVDMAQAAELVAGQLNAFNLAASEGKRVSDVLTRATQISAFTFQRLQDSLKVVSPAAKAVGVSIEETIGVLTAAVDANIDAGTAATGLRNIYIDLADKGLTWDQAMEKINGSTNRLSAANELFGKRGAVVATVIANSTEKIDANTKSLENAAGAAKAFAEEQLNNLSGDKLLWTSAWEGFILKLEEGDGLMARMARTTIQAFTSALSGITRAMGNTNLEMELWQKWITDVKLSNEELNGALTNLIKKINQENEAFSELSSVSARNAAKERIEELQQRKKFLLDIGKQRADLAAAEAKTLQDRLDAEQKLRDDAASKILAARIKLESLLHDLTIKGVDNTKSAFLQEVEAKKAANDTIKNIEDKLAKDLISIQKRITDSEKDASDERVRIAEEEAKKKAEEEKLLAETKQNIINQSFELAAESANRFTDLRIQRISDELTALEFARDRELEKEGLTERAKFDINKKFDAQRKELQRKQVIAERANALFQIAINTATAIIKTGATLGYPAAIPFVIAAAAMGAVQSAAVIAAPIPQFDEGSDNTPKDYIAGEKRPELRKSKGKWSLVDKPTLFKDSKGDQIVSGKETDSIMGNLSDLTGQNLLTKKGNILSLLNNEIKHERKQDNGLAYVLKQNNNELIRTIKNKKELNVAINTGRPRIQEKDGKTYIDRIDKYYRR